MKYFSFLIIILCSCLVHFKGFAQEFDADINLAIKLSNEGKYQDAAELFEKWAPIAKERLGKNDTTVYLRLVSWAGNWYYKAGQYMQAEALIKEEVRIMKEVLGENHSDFGTSLNHLALLYLAMSHFDQAEVLMNLALKIVKESFGESHPIYATNLNNLAQLYQKMGRYEQAESLMKEVLRIDNESLGKNDASYCRDINNLAFLYLEIGRFDLAEPLMNEAIRISKKTIGENNPDYSSFLKNLAQLYQKMGRNEEAEPLMKEAIRIDKESLGENHPDYGLDLNNLAVLYQAMGRYEEAASYLEEALRIMKETLGENHPSYVTSLSNLAELNIAVGSYEQAEALIKKTILITKETLGENHPSYAIELNNLAMLFYEYLGLYNQAETLMKQAMRLDQENLAKSHPSYGIHIHNLILTSGAVGYTKQLESLMKEAVSILKDNLRTNSNYLSETETEKLNETILFSLDIYQSLNYQQILSNEDIGDFAMDIELFQKGLLLNSIIETRKSILYSGDTSLINRYQTMMAIRKQAEKLNSLPKVQRYEDPAILDAKANDIEKDLKLRSKEYSRSLEEAEITWKQVQDKMKPDEAVVEFASFPYYNKQWTDSILYCALVLRKQDTIPHMVYLFEEKQLAETLPKPGNSSDAIINNTYAVLRGNKLIPDSSWYQGENLYNLVWKPLDCLLSGIKTVSFACSGLLNTISFAAIPDATGKLLCERYSLNQYSSTRNLAIETTELPITDAVIYGGIQYEVDTTLMIANARKYSKSDSFALEYNSTRSGNKRGNGFDELEGTRGEANSINALFKEKKITTNNYTNDAANEESFKAMATRESPSVIHLSTHGFYYPDTITQRNQASELQFMGSDLNRFQYSPDPLLRSGIVLAGANCVWRGEQVPDGIEDGILTAKDVSQLNLSNTQLVVLSACQTGLGDVKGSEGVFGLQRAFKMAGVRYLMMSLWSVPDKETKEFMEKFYTHWLSGIPIRSAFQKTQQEMRLEYPKEPYKWAAFILVE